MTNFKSLQKENEALKSKLKHLNKKLRLLRLKLTLLKKYDEYDVLAVSKRAVDQ